ncbi:fungal-specific transcription factor domain-containing protein [Radiomyces spectabilis]|uniref:fungal-specific transcription factor domain-containing protein n=1 Tax=Radiomyces spectabilis TaxID=64574 RepID=UPI00221F5655|nr:fungal-specific transcription factor domain-containing protein [Radiomyces spectabilis]KAI8391513.1 fungal-specific transcription factor domain-containing protein [Radiomyces spectabilis]
MPKNDHCLRPTHRHGPGRTSAVPFGLDHPNLQSRKRPQGASSDRVQYLGDLSSFQLFSNKIQLKGNDHILWRGKEHLITKFGEQVVLLEDEAATDHGKIPALLPELILPKTSVEQWIYDVTGLDRHTSDQLLKIYFANIHPVLPVINKTDFLKQYRDQADTYPPADLLNAMFGAAARFMECEDLNRKNKSSERPETAWDVPVGWSDRFFDRAQQIICMPTGTSSIAKVQAIILIHNHSGNLDSKSSACWLLGGMAIRLAQNFGLNRNCEHWDIPESEKQTRKRIWWSLLVTDRFQAASLGRPISIRDEDNDIGYPDATASWQEILDVPDPSDDDHSGPRFPSAMRGVPKNPEGRAEIYQLFIQLVKLSEILGHILQGLYTPKAQKLSYQQGSDAIVTRLDHELTEWRFGFPKALQQANFDDFDDTKGYLAPVIASVLLCYFSLLILLHRPFIEQVKPGKPKARPSYSSFRIGTSAATRGMRIAGQMSRRDFLMFPYSFSLYPVLQCCLILMYNTKNPDARISAPAKDDLAKGLTLINSLSTMSHTAEKLNGLLTTIMSNKDVDVSVKQADADADKKKKNQLDGIKTNLPSRLSDVGRGTPIISMQSSPKEVHATTTPTSSAGATATATATRSNDVSATNSPKEHHPYALNLTMDSFLFQKPMVDNVIPQLMDFTGAMGSSPSPTLNSSEAFTLKQFGFTTPGDPSQLDYTMQDVSLFSGMEALPPMPIYGQPNSSGDYPLNIAQPSMNLTQMMSDPMPSSGASASAAPATVSAVSGVPMASTSMPQDATTIFRNNPNNPFWGIPSSMDWTEWNEWNQRTQGSAAWQPLT